MFDINKIRQDFPILSQSINGHPLVYFDNAATTQKPKVVIDALSEYYSNYNANIHRGIHTLAEKATAEYELTRETVKKFINAESIEQIIFTSGVTHGINLVAQTYGKAFLKEGDEVVISTMEHHSNIVPWQLICEEKKAILKVIPIFENGELDLDSYKILLTTKTKIVAIVHASNALGTINPVKEMIKMAHENGAVVLLDGAQSCSHIDIDVQDLDVDFMVLSSHKLYGPTGVGVLYGKRQLLEAMPPYQSGGEMIKDVTFEKTTYNDLPYKFEAGTPNIADVVAFRKAIEYIDNIGKKVIADYEMKLHSYLQEMLLSFDNVRLIGTAKEKVSVQSFVVDGIHHQDIGIILDTSGIAVRTGHHCTQPLMSRLGLLGTTRASISFYNTIEEIDLLEKGLKKVFRMMA